MRFTYEQMNQVINGWLSAGNGRLYKEVDGDGYFADFGPWEEQCFYDDYKDVYENAVYNTLMAVQSLREQGETDDDIRALGYVMPETIDRWNAIEDVARIDRYTFDTGGDLYLGRFYDGDYFMGFILSEPADIVTDSAIHLTLEELTEDPFDIHTGAVSIGTLGELWLNTPAKRKHEHYIKLQRDL